jgi:hypothetical protein
MFRARKNWKNPLPTILPSEVLDELARSAKVSDTEIFHWGLTWAVLHTIPDEKFCKPVYKGQLIDRLDGVMRQGILFERQLAELLDPRTDPATFSAKEFLCDLLDGGISDLAELRSAVESLVSTIMSAKLVAARRLLATRGRPKGAGNSGGALDNFIARLEFAARAAGGSWTLNKNGESGTLISALEVLKKYLPDSLSHDSIHTQATKKL